ncbi:MAG: VPLPA-CTERM sorting domain-containing protein [Parvularcula sp.]
MKKLARVLASITLGATAIAGSAQAALIATASAPSGSLRYEGLGELTPGSGIGTGFYQLGDCAFDGSQTVCTVSGSYVEDASSTLNPGDTGTFVFRQIFSGAVNPVTARSDAPGSNSLFLNSLGDAIFEIDVTTSGGATYSGIFPAMPFSDSIGFAAFVGPSVSCTGLSPSTPCSISNVGLTPGAVLLSNISPFQFSLPDSILMADPVPLPAAAWLFGTALVGAGAARRRRQKS